MSQHPAASPPPAPQPLFQRAHKSALGFAFGTIFGLGLFLVTAFHIVLGIQNTPLWFLQHYFQGYGIRWSGAFAGLGWGFAVGFIAGWLLGFVHNFTVGVWLMFIRARADLKSSGNFLDHI
jgi:hypothetical protein